MAEGCDSQVVAYEGNPELLKVETRLEEKMVEYSKPQVDTRGIQQTRYGGSFTTAVNILVERVSTNFNPK